MRDFIKKKMGFLLSLSDKIFNPQFFWGFFGAISLVAAVFIFLSLWLSSRNPKVDTQEEPPVNFTNPSEGKIKIKSSPNEVLEIPKPIPGPVLKAADVPSDVSVDLASYKKIIADKEEALHREIVDKEKVWVGLKNKEQEVVSLKEKLSALTLELENTEKEHSGIESLKEGLRSKDAALANEKAQREKLLADIKEKEIQITSFKDEISGLRNSQNQAAPDTRVIDSLKKELALKEEALIAANASQEKLAADFKDREARLVSLQEEVNSLKSLKDSLAQSGTDVNLLKEELRKNQEMLANEKAQREKLLAQLKDKDNSFKPLEEELNKLKSQPAQQGALDNLKEDLIQKEEALRNETISKEKLWKEFQDAGSQLMKMRSELDSSKEVYQGLKEQYADLERLVDALNQSLALEKTLHQRIKEEHSKCLKTSAPTHSTNPSS